MRILWVIGLCKRKVLCWQMTMAGLTPSLRACDHHHWLLDLSYIWSPTQMHVYCVHKVSSQLHECLDIVSWYICYFLIIERVHSICSFYKTMTIIGTVRYNQAGNCWFLQTWGTKLTTYTEVSCFSSLNTVHEKLLHPFKLPAMKDWSTINDLWWENCI